MKTTSGRPITAQTGLAYVARTRGESVRRFAVVNMVPFWDMIAQRFEKNGFFRLRSAFEQKADAMHEATMRKVYGPDVDDLELHRKAGHVRKVRDPVTGADREELRQGFADEAEEAEVKKLLGTRGVIELERQTEDMVRELVGAGANTSWTSMKKAFEKPMASAYTSLAPARKGLKGLSGPSRKDGKRAAPGIAKSGAGTSGPRESLVSACGLFVDSDGGAIVALGCAVGR